MKLLDDREKKSKGWYRKLGPEWGSLHFTGIGKVLFLSLTTKEIHMP